MCGRKLAFFQEFFSGGGAKFIVMQISFVMLIFLLFPDQISGRGQTASGGRPLPPCGRKPGRRDSWSETMTIDDYAEDDRLREV